MSAIKELLLDKFQKLADETGIDVQRLMRGFLQFRQGESFEEYADKVRQQIKEE